MSHVDPHEKGQTSLIESLNTDALAEVMSACYSLEDLRALIHASPVLYRGFLSAKRTILLNMVEEDLGPGIRDAVGFVLIGKLDTNTSSERFREQIKQAVRRYAALPAGRMAVSSATDGHIIKIIQINRAVQFFARGYITARLYLTQFEGGASNSERLRISCAIIRHQFLTTLRPQGDWKGEGTYMFHNLFQAWEIQQIAMVHSFIGSFSSHFIANNPIGELKRETWDLVELRRNVIAEKLMQEPEHYNIRKQVKDEINYLKSGYFSSCFEESHFFLSQAIGRKEHLIPSGSEALDNFERRRDRLYAREKEMPAITAGRLATDPPYAWVDALDGLNCCRWGFDLVRVPGPETTTDYHKVVVRKIIEWCWTGYAFWDKEHVEALKKKIVLRSEYPTGWAINIWDEDAT
ncbi:hypothetical protein NUW58_g1968 [Xylaria curta]|uniref:Uncharacterized protein n=1 Tax=Xylaria curta TaxID=42375 RepID=A0ACC1PJ69_9PEZI|nr:hypothetical protein NUW58_g1968 [Xylaria curta]